MRIRILRVPEGDVEVDGVSLAAFQVGMMYDVGASLATYLVSSHCAAVIESDTPALVVPLTDMRSDLTLPDRLVATELSARAVRESPAPATTRPSRETH